MLSRGPQLGSQEHQADDDPTAHPNSSPWSPRLHRLICSFVHGSETLSLADDLYILVSPTCTRSKPKNGFWHKVGGRVADILRSRLHKPLFGVVGGFSLPPRSVAQFVRHYAVNPVRHTSPVESS